MNQPTRKAILLIALFLLVGAPTPAIADTISGKIVSIADGDTVTIQEQSGTQTKIRLNGIDSPELAQRFGQEAKRNLAQLCEGKQAVVVWSKVDKYGRTVGTVLIGSLNANLEQLRGGFAWYFRQYAADVAELERIQYDTAEREAKETRRGLWADPNPQAPWLFRHPEQLAESSSNTASSTTRTSNGQHFDPVRALWA